jgi:cell wall-associated NlpC family hydrolase
MEGKTLAVAFAGGVILYSAIKGKKVTGALKDILGGKNPDAAGNTSITDPTSTLTLDATTGGAGGIAGDATAYIGHSYSYGGYEADPSGWDCSSFVNWVVGHDAGMAIPGYAAGTYQGTSHGPATIAWLAWNGTTTIAEANIQSGDLCVWETHMGICTGGGNMISALNPSLATRITTISGAAPPGEVLVCKRLG